MKILVAIDFSDNAEHAAAYALTWAQASGDSVQLLHVVEPPISDPRAADEATAIAHETIQELSKKLKLQAPDCDIISSVRVGSIVDEVNKTALEIQANLIVMGLRGLSPGNRSLLGSNAVSLVRNASCAILVVPDKAQLRQPKKIAFATDYYDSDLEALKYLLPTARIFNSEIEVVHVFDEKEEQESEGFMMDAISGEIRKKIDYPVISFKVFHNSSVSEGIHQFSEATQADIIVLSARKLNVVQKMFGSSVSEQIIYKSSVPVMVFHTHPTNDHIMNLA